MSRARATDAAHRLPIRFEPGAVAPVLGLATMFALFGLQLGIPFWTGFAIGGVGGTASLLAHEFGHVRVARRLTGIRSASVSLIWLGAATHLEGRYRSGREQVRVALAGPRASFGFAGGLALMTALPLPAAPERAVMLLAALNVAIGLLNLIPAAPLDGYKLLLGVTWAATGSERRARRVLGRLGRAATFAILPATAALLAVRPSLAVAVGMMSLTLVAQKRLLAKPSR